MPRIFSFTEYWETEGATMKTPLQLETQGFRPSWHLREIILAQIAKLERQFGRMTACRVAIRAPNAHHRNGEPYSVSIWISLPGRRQVNVKPPPKGWDRRQSEPVFATNDAFRRADRQLRDFSKRLRDVRSEKHPTA